MSCSFGPYATPKDLEGTRAIIPYSSNQTASYVPNYFLGSGPDSPERNKDNSIMLEKKFCSQVVEEILVSLDEKANLSRVVKKIKPDIENHIEVRLQLFLVHIISLYQSEIIVDQFRTQTQAGIKNKQAEENSLVLAEAHASTLPNLIGNTKKEENDFFLQKRTDLKPRILFKNTSYYLQFNITHKLPSLVNHLDSNIDFRTKTLEWKNNTFREISIEILKRCGDGRINPQDAFQKFLVCLHEKIGELEADSHNHEKIALSYYNKVVESYLRQNADSNFIKRLMFNPGNFDPYSFGKTLRKKVRFELALVKQIEKIKKACTNLLRTTYHFNDMIKCLLVLGTDYGRLVQLEKKTHMLSSTQIEYINIGVKNKKIVQAAKKIIDSDLSLQWVEEKNLEAPKKFVTQVRETISEQAEKNVKEGNIIALRILWKAAKSKITANEELLTFLCFLPEEALDFMESHPTVRKNVKACLKDDKVTGQLDKFEELLKP